MVKPGVLLASAFVVGLTWRGHYQAAIMVGLCTATLSLLATMLVRAPPVGDLSANPACPLLPLPTPATSDDKTAL